MKMIPSPTYEIRVLGCKVNQYDAQQIRCVLEAAGLRPPAADEPPGVVVVHTCAVTSAAARKSLQAIRKALSAYPGAHAIVTGCGTAMADFNLPAQVQAVIPPHPEWLRQLAAELERLPVGADAADIAADVPVEEFVGHTRAFLKIQDGCDVGCSYCIVPRLRRGSRDRPIEVVVQEAAALAEKHAEIVVSGVSVGLYGKRGGARLADVMRALVNLPDTRRLRLSSLHPAELTSELLKVWASSPKMMPHVHLPLQSGSDAVLKAMRRGYTAADFRDAVKRARDCLNEPALTTDVIVGFPGETDEDFERTIEVCRQVGFSRMHVFPYSRRPETAAARMPNQVVAATRQKRASALRAVAAELSLSFHRNFEGRTVRVLVENRRRGGAWEGYSEHYVPVRFKGPEDLRGRIVPVCVEKAAADHVTGVISR